MVVFTPGAWDVRGRNQARRWAAGHEVSEMKQRDADALKDERDSPQTTRRAGDGGERRKREEDLSPCWMNSICLGLGLVAAGPPSPHLGRSRRVAYTMYGGTPLLPTMLLGLS